jgi:Mg-chelatase subunit ChlD
MRALRAAREWVRRQQPAARHESDSTVITITDLQWAGRGWRTTGDALLALSAAARAREEMAITS